MALVYLDARRLDGETKAELCALLERIRGNAQFVIFDIPERPETVKWRMKNIQEVTQQISDMFGLEIRRDHNAHLGGNRE